MSIKGLKVIQKLLYAGSTSSSRGTGAHQEAEGREYIRQQRAGSTSGSRGPGAHQAGEAGSTSGIGSQKYIKKQRAGSTSAS